MGGTHCRNLDVSAAAFLELPAASACTGVVAPDLWRFTHDCSGGDRIAVYKIPSVLIFFKARDVGSGLVSGVRSARAVAQIL